MFTVFQFVIVSLTGWGLLIGGLYKVFTRGKKDEEVLQMLNVFIPNFFKKSPNLLLHS